MKQTDYLIFLYSWDFSYSKKTGKNGEVKPASEKDTYSYASQIIT